MLIAFAIASESDIEKQDLSTQPQARIQDFEWVGALSVRENYLNRWGARGSGGVLTSHCYF